MVVLGVGRPDEGGRLREDGCTVVVPPEGHRESVALLAEDDVLVVPSLGHLGELPTALGLMAELGERGVRFRSLDEPALDTTGATGHLVAGVVEALAAAAIGPAASSPRRVGRKPVTIADPKVRTAVAMHADPTIGVPEICQRLGISRATFYRYVRLARAES